MNKKFLKDIKQRTFKAVKLHVLKLSNCQSMIDKAIVPSVCIGYVGYM